MDLEQLVGTVYGPYRYRVTAERVAAYVAATGDDADRWVKHAPPSFAGALLFAAAPSFLGDPVVVPYTKRMVHADQSFTWHRPIEIGETVEITGVFSRARERAGFVFASFDAEIESADGPLITSVSTFLLGAGEADGDVGDDGEPPVLLTGRFDPIPEAGPVPGEVAAMERSASRLGLVRYASASGDFNPVHFDHQTALEAGFSGVLVHGLLMGAWVLQSAGSYSQASRPVTSAKLRFRNPLRPAVTARLGGTAEPGEDGAIALRLSLRTGDVELVSARIAVAGE